MAAVIALRKTVPLTGLYAQLQDPLPLEEGYGLQTVSHHPSTTYRRLGRIVVRKLQAVEEGQVCLLTPQEALTLLASCLTTRWTTEGRVIAECGIGLEVRLLLAEAGEGKLARRQALLPLFEREEALTNPLEGDRMEASEEEAPPLSRKAGIYEAERFSHRARHHPPVPGDPTLSPGEEAVPPGH